MKRPVRIPAGCRPLSTSERRRITKENAEALFPSVALQRYEATCKQLEKSLRAQHAEQAPTTSSEG